ncbi:hypothetical protein BDK51DRAFT_37346 [Blyttiomyces helicus]|uniref:Uncharacterized protein n=1 Tax=Blyttiomyces helicus TaxID=388810 RepID=A0A4P9W2W8_9FUNG|nr:hypothetical protein BDK51DRAFT_37346 [Blyttiomyces helicus]|eukprot:RKO85735.1 hypothetical protein BDK51DRAFT_37346 [Blyttiomyces helicus]
MTIHHQRSQLWLSHDAARIGSGLPREPPRGCLSDNDSDVNGKEPAVAVSGHLLTPYRLPGKIVGGWCWFPGGDGKPRGRRRALAGRACVAPRIARSRAAIRLPLLALAQLSIDAVQRGPDGRPSPMRRLTIKPFAMPAMRVLEFALPMFAHLRALIVASASETICALSDSLCLRGIATILKACKRLVVFTWTGPVHLANTDDQEWATVDMPAHPADGRALNDQGWATIRMRWAVTGNEDISSLVTGACQNLDLLRVSATLGPIRPGLFASLSPRAPFPGIEELDLANQRLLTDTALDLLSNHRPLKVFDIKGTTFTAPAVVALIAARGSLLESLSIEETTWPTLRSAPLPAKRRTR